MIEGNWGGRRGLNPRHSVPQTDALPAELLPPLPFSLSRHSVVQNPARSPQAPPICIHISLQTSYARRILHAILSAPLAKLAEGFASPRMSPQ
jgi:hypothetical protein